MGKNGDPEQFPSSTSWSFLPRQWTHHISWIEPDANNPDYVFVAIEAGALVQSHDGGKTWIDRIEEGPYDIHTLATHIQKHRDDFILMLVTDILKALIMENRGADQQKV
jgi:hypothetical protein